MPLFFFHSYVHFTWIFWSKPAVPAVPERQCSTDPLVMNCTIAKGHTLWNHPIISHQVGGLEHFLFFHILGIIIPTDFHIFQRGRYTTNQYTTHGWSINIWLVYNFWKWCLVTSKGKWFTIFDTVGIALSSYYPPFIFNTSRVNGPMIFWWVLSLK